MSIRASYAHRLAAIAAVLSLVAGCGDDTGSDTGPEPEGGGTIAVQISGEELGTDGFLFPTGSEVTLVDGWEIEFTHVLVTVGEVTVSEDPDLAPSDQSQTGEAVAHAHGAFAVDLHREGSVPGAGGEGTATPLLTLTGQDLRDGAPFAADQRYAFSYEVLAASAGAERVNFAGDAEAEAAYEEMIAKGYAVLYVGRATFKGSTCATSDPAYDFAQIPTTIDFRLGFATPASFINCQNQENQGEPFPDEEYQRGIAVLPNEAALAQITLHLDHPFYSDVEHEPALYFGQMAARLVGQPAGTVLTEEHLAGVDPTAFTDGAGAPLPWRACDGSALPLGAQMGFETGSVPVNPAGDPASALRDYGDFVRYVQSTQAHLNGGEGLCYVQRNYPSPH